MIADLTSQSHAQFLRAQRDDARYTTLSLWSHALFLSMLVFLVGSAGLVSYRREVDRRRLSEESERKIRALLEHGGDAILLVDDAGVVTFASGACPQILGADAEELIHTSFHELAQTLGVARLSDVIESSRRSPGELLTETMPLGEDDVTIVEVNVCDYSRVETVEATIVNIRDITERLLTQAALEREESFSTDLMERAPLWIYVSDLELRFLRVNRLFALAMGHKADVMVGSTASELFPAGLADLLETNARRALVDGEVTTEQTFEIGGVQTSMLATYFILRDSAGSPYAVAAVAIDMTEVEELRTIERELRAGFTHATDAMVTSYEGRITSWNRSAEEMFGYTSDEILGREIGVLLAPSQRDRVPSFQSALYEGRAVTAERLIGQRRDGSTFVGSLTAVPIVDGSGVVRAVSSVIHDRTAELTLQAQLRTDSLTGLPNREALIEHLQSILNSTGQDNEAPSEMFYLAKMRVDRFDQFLSVFGGSTAEALLRVVTDRLTAFVRRGVFVARSGPRDFAFAFTAESRQDAESFVQEVLSAVTEPTEVENRALNVSMTVGVSPCQSDDVGVIMSRAALLSQRERSVGAEPIAFFDERREFQLVRDVTLIEELRSALADHQLVPYYQPIVDLATNQVVGFEALARWPHEVRGLVTPDRFVGLAEESGLIDELGRQIRFSACHQLVEWQKLSGRSGLEMHLNVSVHELADSDFVTVAARMLERTGVDPHAVVFEITESALANTKETSEKLRDVSALGVRWSIDDFGTGYSSLSYLRVFPLESLKIDRTFVMDWQSAKGRSMLKSIIDMAGALGLRTISEGIETPDQRDLMIELGADRGQGYFWLRPAPADEAYGFLRAGLERP
ncbi:MAG: sensor domain-containing protein [Acidimicrobiales bacterium]